MRIRDSIIAEIVQDHCQRAATGDVRRLVAFWRDRATQAVRERDVDTGRDVVEAIQEITDVLRVRKEVLRADLVETALVIGDLEEVRRRLADALVEAGGIDDEVQARRGITAGTITAEG
jgi:hypothetical protein